MPSVHDDPADVQLRDGEVVAATFVPDPEGSYVLPSAAGDPPTPCRAVYFAAPADASDDWMREKAFEIREGRPMDAYQRWVIEEAKQTQNA